MIQYTVRISNSVNRFRAATISTNEQDERGAGLVEYAMLIGLIVIVCVAAVSLLGDATNEPYSELGSQLGS
jgi:Flp pilus assembly pilin Flp